MSSVAARAFRLCWSLSSSWQGSMYILEPMSAEPIASLYESADQPLPSSSASPQCTSRLYFEESQIAVVMLMMPGSSGLTKTSDRVFSHSTSLHWSAAKRSSPIKSYRRRTVCLFPDPSSLLPDSETAEPTFVNLAVITSLIATKEVSIRVHGLRLPQTCHGVLHVMNTRRGDWGTFRHGVPWDRPVSHRNYFANWAPSGQWYQN